MANASTSSGLKTTSGAIVATGTPALLHSVSVVTGSADGSVIILTGGSSGTVLLKMPAKTLANGFVAHLDTPIAANDGIYATLAGTGVECIVHYSLA